MDDLRRILADEVRAAIAETSPAPRVEADEGDPAAAEARRLLARAAELVTPAVPSGAPLEPVKRLAIRALRFLWRNQATYDTLMLDALARVIESVERSNRATERELDVVRRRGSVGEGRLALLEARGPAAASGAPVPAASPAPGFPPGVYALFEERFRGSPEAIAAGQRDYLRWLRGLPGPVLDVGCGRGEFLCLLAEAGIAASGVESNPVTAAACRAAGLDVAEGDAFDALARRPDASLGAVTAFQVVEHWEPASLYRFLREARRALAPGGALVLETVNTDSLSALRTFYLDPTHVRPVPPEALRFLVEALGFVDAVLELRSPLPASARLEESSDNDRKLNALLFGPQDYALVARVPRRALRPRRVLVLSVQSPFTHGGAERHVRRLTEELARRGVEADLVAMPVGERERFDLVRAAAAWRSLDLNEVGGRPVDAVIATRFPTWAIRHPNKVVWLIHQYRPAYDQYGTSFSDLTASPEDRRTREVIAQIDRVGLTEARRVFANSRTVAARLQRYNGIASEPLYHPPPLVGRYRSGPSGDTVLWVGRLEAWKRPGLLLEALPHAPEARAVFVGRGPEAARLAARAEELGVAGRVRFVGEVDDEALLELYASARIVAVTAAGEDLGYVPLEAFLSGKPVLTTEDAGGPLEFVSNGETGIVAPPRPEALGVALRLLWPRADALAAMGAAGRARAARLDWDGPVHALLEAAGLA